MAKIVDVSMAAYDGMKGFPVPWILGYEIRPTATHDRHGRSVMRITASSHTGTHIDAPFHFVPDGQTIDEISVASFIGPGVLVDLSHKGPLGEVTTEDLESNKEILADDILLIRTDWSDRWGNDDFFTHSPFLSLAAVDWLIERGIRGIGVDTASIEDPREIKPGVVAPVHRRILGCGMFIIEGLTNLKEVIPGRLEVIALPLRLQGADGAPARVVVRIPE